MALDAAHFLARFTARQWLADDDEERQVVTDPLLEVLPPQLVLATTVGHTPTALPMVIHQPTKYGLFVVFGDRCIMGRSPAEAVTLRSRPGDEYEDTEVASSMVPVRTVDVAPVLLGEAFISGQWLSAFGLSTAPRTDSTAHARAALSRHGFRLPSEAELELAWRVTQHGGPAVPALWSGLCADAWHFDFAGAPTDGRPWGDQAEVVRVVANEWSAPTWPERRMDPRSARARVELRPAWSLLPDDVAYSKEAVAARSALPPLGPA